MKTLKSYFGALLVSVLALISCAPEDFGHLDPNGVPTVEGIDFNCTVDQTTNTVTLSLDDAVLSSLKSKAISPLWVLYNDKGDASYATTDKVERIYKKAGEYKVELKLRNKNGISDASVEKSFVIDRTIGGFYGFKYDSEFNLWKPIDEGKSFEMLKNYFAHGDGWEGYNADDFGYMQDGNSHIFTLPFETNQQWQCQYFFLPENLKLEGNKTYDFSCVISSDKDLPGVTVKIPNMADNGPALFAERVAVKAGEDYVFYITDCPGFDDLAKLVLDFGGNPEKTTVTISNIVLKDHANDDGTVLPKEEEGEHVIWADVDSPANLMSAGELSVASTFWAAGDDWHGCAAPEVNVSGRNAKIKVVEANGTLQWQGQVHLNTQVAIEEGKAYDFSIKFTPSQDFNGVTVKPHPEGDDGHFFSEGRHDLTSNDENVVTYENFVADFSTGNLVITLDFPGCAAGTTIDVTDIIVQEHNATGGSISWPDVDSQANLFSAANLVLNSTFWAAGDDWHGCEAPDVKVNGRTAKIRVLEGNGVLQWQGQVHLGSGVAMEQGAVYNFAITINPSHDLAGVTVKPHPAGDDGHFISEGRHDLVGGEDNVVTYVGFASDFATDDLVITLDFPGCEKGAEIAVKDIILFKQ